MSEVVHFKDILVPRKVQYGIIKFMSRSWEPQKTMTMDKYFSPQDLKDAVANSVYIDSIIEAESQRTGVRREKLKRKVEIYLEEMGLDKKMYVVRWLGIFLLKILFMMNIGIFVNEPAILKLRASMGKNPVLFLPTHRSYADFCLMTYLCFHYDIDLPAVAAGMDFYSMAVMGRRMRETCAFYIRRTLVGAPLYAATLRQYMRTLVSKHSAPIEFFIEGTRSRSNKSLPPKYGMLSMSLSALFAREVPDITIVPLNISYDRLMEHGLFAYEHLGVPKPKESTGSFLKSLNSLNDHFGNAYVNLGTPFSVKDHLQNQKPSSEMLKPSSLQDLTSEQFGIVQDLAHYVISLQQKCTVATISNLLALVLMQSLIKNQVLVFNEVVQEVQWVIGVLKKLGASVFEDDVKADLERILVVHSKMMNLDQKNGLRLVSSALMNVSPEVKKKMKGHTLKAETMVNAVPIIQLQLYVNPVMHYLVPPAILCILVHRSALTREQLISDYKRVRILLKHEFFYYENMEDEVLVRALEYCAQNNVLVRTQDLYGCGSDERLQHLLRCSVWPALSTALNCAHVMHEQVKCEHKQALRLIQSRVESGRCHPYCLSLELIANCLQGLVLLGGLAKDKQQQEVTYSVVSDVLEECRQLIASVLPRFDVDFGRSNSVILNQKPVVAKL